MLAYRGGDLSDKDRNEELSASLDALVAARYITHRKQPVILIYKIPNDAKIWDFSAEKTCPEVFVKSSQLIAICDPLAIPAIASASKMHGNFQKYQIEVAPGVFRQYSRKCSTHRCILRADGSCVRCGKEQGKMTLKDWQREISLRHPITRHWPLALWPRIARLNGWLPLPPKEQGK